VQYWQEIGAVNLADLVFVDETGSNLSMTRRYARALKGDRAYRCSLPTRQLDIDWCNGATGTRWRNDLAWSHRCTGLQDLCRVLVPNLWSGACVVMDNLPAHKVAGIRGD